ncbi:prohead core scaffolding protein and protease [Xanthomonas phage XacN1]|nr:prohead core scaffolding protein and protease [Xanthomonas phage XacN1]
MKQAILVEHLNAAQGNIITEAVNDGKNVFLSGIVMQADIQNRNGRIYPLAEMTAAVNSMRQSIQEYGGVFGELDHPADRISINLDRVSHVITEVYMDGSNVMGKMKILDTPVGLIAKELAKSGVRYGVSSRGTGVVSEGMVSNFNLQTIDLVATPSAQGAYPTTMFEALQEQKGRKVLTLAEAVREDPEAQKFFESEVKKFLESICKK